MKNLKQDLRDLFVVVVGLPSVYAYWQARIRFNRGRQVVFTECAGAAGEKMYFYPCNKDVEGVLVSLGAKKSPTLLNDRYIVYGRSQYRDVLKELGRVTTIVEVTWKCLG